MTVKGLSVTQVKCEYYNNNDNENTEILKGCEPQHLHKHTVGHCVSTA